MAKKKKRKNRILKFLVKVAFVGLLLLALFVGAIYIGLFGALPSETELAGIQQENASLIYSSDNRLIGKIFAKNRTQVDSAAMPDYLLNALVATEDRRFFEHSGVDFWSYVRVIVRTIILQDKAGGGGSTITQQLAKNLFGRPNFGFLSMPISKVKEAIIATRLERIYSKHQLLVLYFNTVPFGENTWGIEAASQRYFDLPISEVSVPQAALLVGMLKANTAFNPRLNPEAATTRRNTVLALMRNQDYLTAEEAEKFMQSALDLDYTNYALYNPSGHFVYKVTKEAKHIIEELNLKSDRKYDLEKDGLMIKTTLNYQMQVMAVNAIKKQLMAKQAVLSKELSNSREKKAFYKKHAELVKDTVKKVRQVFQWDTENPVAMTKIDSAWQYQQLLHASMLAMQPETGEVVVWVGGNNFRYLPYDLVTAKRQSASAFKPILYAAAVENGQNPCDYYNNEQVVYEEFDNWSPQNYSGGGEGEVAMWYALSRSLNIPTVDLYMKTGHENVRHVAGDLGLELPRKVTPAVSLGSESFSLQQLTTAYAAFANHGVLTPAIIIKEITDKDGNVIYAAKKARGKRVLTEVTSQVISSMLITAVKEGTGRSMSSRYGVKSELAGKTGTSQNYSDAWFVSFNQDLVCGVWVGAMSPQIHFRSGGNGSGSALALPVAARFYKQVESNSVLRKRYLTGFSSMPAATEPFGCEGMREKGLLNRMFDNVFQGYQRGEEGPLEEFELEDVDTNEKEEGFVKRSWKKIFKK